MRFKLLIFVVFSCFFTFYIQAEVNDISSKAVTNNNITKNGKIIPAEYFNGHVLVFYFFSDDMDSWVRPINILNYLTREFEGKNVKIGACTTKSKEQIEKQMKKIDFVSFVKKIDFPIITKSKTAELLNIKAPCVWVAGPTGGASRQKLDKNLNDTISELLNKKSLPQNEKNNKITRENLIAGLEGVLVRFDMSVPAPPPGKIMGGIPVPHIDRDINGITERRMQEKAEKPKILDTKQRKSALPPARNNTLYEK